MNNTSRIIKVLAALLAVYASLMLVRLQLRLAAVQRRIETLTDQCREDTVLLGEKQSGIDSADSADTIADYAFSKLSMVFADEIVFYDGG